jgi:hypothetical protein
MTFQMKIITGFEEGFSTIDRPPNPSSKDYDQIFEVVKHSLGVAETAFARGAKKELKQALLEKLQGGFEMQEALVCANLFPFWVQESHISVQCPEPKLTAYLSGLVQNLAVAIINHAKGAPLILVDPLQTRIVPVGDAAYQFRLKQKWTVNNE